MRVARTLLRGVPELLWDKNSLLAYSEVAELERAPGRWQQWLRTASCEERLTSFAFWLWDSLYLVYT